MGLIRIIDLPKPTAGGPCPFCGYKAIDPKTTICAKCGTTKAYRPRKANKRV